MSGTKYITMDELGEKLGGRSRTALEGDIAAGRLPKPFKLGRRNYWDEAEVDEAIAALRNPCGHN